MPSVTDQQPAGRPPIRVLVADDHALFRRGLEIDPIEAATNVTTDAGDLGQARSVAMLAVTIAQAASGAGSALCAEFGEFGGNDRLALFFAIAPKGSA